MITTIFLDLDDTLFDEQPSANRTFEYVCGHAHNKYGMPVDRFLESMKNRRRDLWTASENYQYCKRVGISSWEAMWAGFEGESEIMRKLRGWSPGYRLAVWRNTLKDFGIDDNAFATELAQLFYDERRKRLNVYDDVEPLLANILPKYKTIIVSNGLISLQKEKMDGSGLSGRFDAVCVSEEVSIAKPDPALFELALSRMHATASESVMVGNSQLKDIAGAQCLGIKGIWINRLNEPHVPEVIPDAQIDTLMELPKVLQNWA